MINMKSINLQVKRSSMIKDIVRFLIISLLFFSVIEGTVIAGIPLVQGKGIQITGIVTDAAGNALPGVNVVIKGTQRGTSTDKEGNYSITVDDQRSVLVFSYMGYLSQEIEVGEQRKINIQMKEDVLGLDEVVVVGYGTQKKVNLTGAVDVVSGKDMENRPAENVGQLLQGTSPNLNISLTNEGGEPGAGNNFNIRGVGTLSGSDAPLILVDGVPVDVNTINPDDIESVSVLKDAAASAIYGARAPFGVILITTKKGSKNHGFNFTYSNNFGFASPIGLPHFASSLKVATAMNQVADYTGIGHIFPDEQMERIKGFIDGTYEHEYDVDNPEVWHDYIWAGRHYGNANYDWIQMYFKNNSFRQKHDVSLSGGNDSTQYYISSSFYDQGGLYNYGYDNYNRYNVLINVTSQVKKWLRFDIKSKLSHINTDYPLGMVNLDRHYMFRSMHTFWPTMPMWNEGVDKSDRVHAINNPVIRIMESSGRDKTSNNDAWLTVGTEIEPLKGWKTSFHYSYNFFSQRHTKNPIAVPVYLPDGSVGNVGAPEGKDGFSTVVSNRDYYLVNAISSYEKAVNNHYFKAMVGYESEYSFNADLIGDRTILITEAVPSISTALGETYLTDKMNHWATQAFFTRLSYNYKEKYLIEFNGRYNGSSRFAPDSRWGFFPSISAGYNISKEDFWAPLKNTVNNLKLRASYGSLGNQNVPNYLYLSNIPIYNNISYIEGDERPMAAYIPQIVSSRLTWETVTTLDVGVDAAFLDNRLAPVFDWYDRKTADMFGPAENLPAVLGTSPPQENNAELMTRGWEFSLAWKDLISSDLNYNVRLVIGDSKTTITKYKNEEKLIDGWYEGKRLGEIWGFTTDRMIQTEEEVESMPDQSIFWDHWGPGDIMYTDLDGNDSITVGRRTLDDHGDLSVIGNNLPRYNIGISAGLNWRGIDVNMFWQGVGKRDYFVSSSALNNIFWGIMQDNNNSSFYIEGHEDYWRPADETNILGPNTDAYYPKPYYSPETDKNRQPQTRYLLNAAYLRLKSLQVGYTIPARLTSKVQIQKLRIYFSGENLLTITKLTKLLDPETGLLNKNDYVTGQAEVYPLSRVLSFGINATF